MRSNISASQIAQNELRLFIELNYYEKLNSIYKKIQHICNKIYKL